MKNMIVLILVVLSVIIEISSVDYSYYEYMWVAGNGNPPCSYINRVGIFGTKGVGDINNIPPAKEHGVGFTTSQNVMYYFSGNGNDGEWNDLWQIERVPGDNTFNFTWLKGSNTHSGAAVWGNKGVPNENNTPSARSWAAGWMDRNTEYLYIFGGSIHSTKNDLWMFNHVNWTYIGGTQSINNNGNYGTQFIGDINNIPAGRSGPSHAQDYAGKFWLFGGRRSDFFCNDLWSYEVLTEKWTWYGGNCVGSGNNIGYSSFGTLNVASPSTQPQGRYGGSGWIDSDSVFYTFGGFGLSGSTPIYFNDLFKFDLSYNWTWIGGNTGNPSSVYGTQGVASNISQPGNRYASSRFTDSDGDFLIFGGWNDQRFNEIWRYSPITGWWTFIRGTNAVTNMYGTKGIPNPSNSPAGLPDTVGFIDNEDKLYIIGGIDDQCTFRNNLWCFINVPPLTSSPITTNDLTTSDITTYYQTTHEMSTQEMTTNELTTQEITSNEITTSEFTTNKLSTGSLTTNELSTNGLSTSHLTTDTNTDGLTSDHLSSNSVTSSSVSSNEITTSLKSYDLTTEDFLIEPNEKSSLGDESTQSAIVAIAVILPLFGILACCCIVFLLWRRNKKKKKKTEEKLEPVELNTLG